MTANDYRHMARALALAERGLYTSDPNPRVGCVLVRDGVVVGEGWHCRAGAAHAEIHALRAAGENARGATAYVTLEPCCHHGRTPPCSAAMVMAGVVRVVVAMRDPNPRVAGGGLAQLAAAGVVVDDGIMAEASAALNPGFVSRMTRARPWLRVKLAMSLDGRTALANGVSQWITGDAARHDVQLWRARSSAILTGSGTVVADDPALDVRLAAEELSPYCLSESKHAVRPPLRVVVDSRLRTSPEARLLSTPGPVLFATGGSGEGAEALRAAGAELMALPCNAQGVDLEALMAELGQREVNELWVEAGPTLSGALFNAGLVDELVLYVAPKLLGHGARGLLKLPDFAALEQCPELDILDVRAVGRDNRIIARPR